MTYFDNAATTYPKPDAVYSFMDDYYRNSGGSAGRGSYEMSYRAEEILHETRQLIKKLFNCQAKEVIFEPTATIALNMIIQGVIKSGAKRIYISPFEHNAVTRTLHHFEDNGQITVSELLVNKDFSYDIEGIGYQFDRNKPDFIIVSHASNVVGLVAPVEKIFSMGKKHGAITLVDMAQTAGLVDLNVGSELIDYAVFAGHKTLYGPTGASGFIMKKQAELQPIIFGGTGYDSANPDMPTELPERFEVGTINTASVAGLYASLKWIEDITIAEIRRKEIENRDKLIRILEKYDFIRIVGINSKSNYVGVVSTAFEGISSDVAESVLREHGISVRAGLQCAPNAHRFIGTFPEGTVRFSVGYFNDDTDFEKLCQALEHIEEAR